MDQVWVKLLSMLDLHLGYTQQRNLPNHNLCIEKGMEIEKKAWGLGARENVIDE